MAIKLSFYKNGAIMEQIGVITQKELFDASHAIYEHHYEDGLQFQLHILNMVEQYAVPLNAMATKGQMDFSYAEKYGKQHLAVVAPQNTKLLNLLEIWKISASDTLNLNPKVLIKIYHSTDEAFDWFADRNILMKPVEPAESLWI